MDSAALLNAVHEVQRSHPPRKNEVGRCRKCGKDTLVGPAFAVELAVHFIADVRARPTHSSSALPLVYVLARLVGLCGDCAAIDEVLLEAVSTFIREVRHGA